MKSFRWKALTIALVPAIIAIACSRFDEASPDEKDAGVDAADGGLLDTSVLGEASADGDADADAGDAAPEAAARCATVFSMTGPGAGTIAKCPSGMVRTGCAAYCTGSRAGSVVAVSPEACSGSCITSLAVEVFVFCARFPEAVSVAQGTGEVTCTGGAVRTGCEAACADSGSSSFPIGDSGCNGTCASGTTPTVQALCTVKPSATITVARADGGRQAYAECPPGMSLVDCASECTGSLGGGTLVIDSGACYGACDQPSATATVSAICGSGLCQ